MAEVSLKSLTDWPTGKNVLPKGSHLQESVDALREIANASGYDLRHHRKTITADWKLGKIVAAGPNNEADYDDERYWIELQAISDADPTDTLQVEVDDSEPYVDNSGNPKPIITATNLFEFLDSSHQLATDRLVWVKGKLDLGQPQQIHWQFEASPPRPFFVVLVTDGGANAATPTGVATYTYTAKTPDSLVVIATGLSPVNSFNPSTNREQGVLTGPATCGELRRNPDGSYSIISCNERRALILCP